MHPRWGKPQIFQQPLPLLGWHCPFQVLHTGRSDVLLAQMPQRLHQQSAEAACRRHIARSCAAQLDLLPSKLNRARWPVRQEHHLCRHLLRQPQQVCCISSRRLQANPIFPGQRLRDFLNVRRQDAQFWMLLWIIIKSPCQSAQNSPTAQSVQRQIHGATIAEVKEIARREDRTPF